MLVFQNKALLRSHLNSVLAPNKTVGFVPTMGALHDGHLSLITKSIAENEYTVVSIFVNPTQFNNAEDLEKYPRTLEKDINKIKSICKSVIVYAPNPLDVYDNQVVVSFFSFGRIETVMEGKYRKGHFDGVATVVKRLFEIVCPNKAYFGEKDFQQLLIVKKLVAKEKIPVQIIGCPIYRESSGLAMSSRNERLSEKSREEAKLIYETLQEAKKLFATKSTKNICSWVEKEFQKHTNFTLEYFEIANESTLSICKRKRKTQKYRAFIAVFIDNIRLIDNISLN